MKTTYVKFLFASAAMLGFGGCSDDNENGSLVDETLNSDVIVNFSEIIAQPAYGDLASKTSTLYDQVIALETDAATDAELTAACATWKAARQTWEQTESFLFGPVSTEDIDPRIDTWPVNFNDLNDQLASNAVFTEAYINSLDDALKGFHPIEYLIFGKEGDKTAAELTDREIEYLKGLALNLKTLTANLDGSWDPSTAGNYHLAFTTAGDGSAVYATQKEALEELVNAMAGICDEVANGKMEEPFAAEDPNLEESPFSQNSKTDFTNNIKGVENVYMGKFSSDGKGLEDLVKKYSLQLDNSIKLKLSSAIAALGTISKPFGQAIQDDAERIKVQNAIDAINELKVILEEDLLDFVNVHAE